MLKTEMERVSAKNQWCAKVAIISGTTPWKTNTWLIIPNAYRTKIWTFRGFPVKNRLSPVGFRKPLPTKCLTERSGRSVRGQDVVVWATLRMWKRAFQRSSSSWQASMYSLATFLDVCATLTASTVPSRPICSREAGFPPVLTLEARSHNLAFARQVPSREVQETTSYYESKRFQSCTRDCSVGG